MAPIWGPSLQHKGLYPNSSSNALHSLNLVKMMRKGSFPSSIPLLAQQRPLCRQVTFSSNTPCKKTQFFLLIPTYPISSLPSFLFCWDKWLAVDCPAPKHFVVVNRDIWFLREVPHNSHSYTPITIYGGVCKSEVSRCWWCRWIWNPSAKTNNWNQLTRMTTKPISVHMWW
jgi:hypothetical protein